MKNKPADPQICDVNKGCIDYSTLASITTILMMHRIEYQTKSNPDFLFSFEHGLAPIKRDTIFCNKIIFISHTLFSGQSNSPFKASSNRGSLVACNVLKMVGGVYRLQISHRPGHTGNWTLTVTCQQIRTVETIITVHPSLLFDQWHCSFGRSNANAAINFMLPKAGRNKVCTSQGESIKTVYIFCSPLLFPSLFT